MKRQKPNRWLLWLLAILFVWVVVSRFTEVQALARTLAQGQWYWVAAAALLQVFYYLAYTGLYQAAFYTVGISSRLSDLLPVTFASLFVNVAAPTGGASGAALFMDDAARRGQSSTRAAAGVLLVLVADFATFTLILISGLVVLFTLHNLQIYEMIGALVLLGMIGGLSAILLLGVWRPAALRGLLAWTQQAASRLAAVVRRPPPLAEDWAEKTSGDFTASALAIASHPQRLTRTMGTAFLMHLLDLSSLYALFLAFHQPISLGVLVAGYSMGILFWIVSITPQGIGVVEGVMALVFSSLGVPASNAAVIALSFRGLTFWLPLGIGFVALRRLRAFRAGQRAGRKITSVQVIAILAAVMGLVNVLSAVTPSLRLRMELLAQFLPLEIRHGSHLAAALAGFALLILSLQLWRRKRAAWVLTLLALLVSAAAHLLKGLDYEEAVLALLLAAWLWQQRYQFHAYSDLPSVKNGLVMLLAAQVFTLVYGAAGFYLLDHHYQMNFSLPEAIKQTVMMFLSFSDPGLQPVTHFGRYFASSIYAISGLTGGFALLQIVRPVLLRRAPTPEEREKAQAIVETCGHSSLARLALLPDKVFYFSPGGSLIAYTLEGRTALVLGDPIGPSEDLAGAMRSFGEYCARNDWQPAYYQVQPEGLECYRSAGFDLLRVGQEAIVDLASFTMEGKANKGLRSGYNRIARLGYQAEMLEPPLAPDVLQELREISDAWLALVHGAEKRFSLGWFDDDYIGGGRVMAIRHPHGEIDAFANIVPEYKLDETTIDLMRHRPGSEGGMMDFLFISLFEWARSQGYATFNLGLSGLSGIGEKPEDPAVERALHYLFEHVSRFYNFKGLHEFKAKFHPRWSPRYLAYPGSASLPLVILALIRADSGKGWLRGPQLRGPSTEGAFKP